MVARSVNPSFTLPVSIALCDGHAKCRSIAFSLGQGRDDNLGSVLALQNHSQAVQFGQFKAEKRNACFNGTRAQRIWSARLQDPVMEQKK